MFKHKNQQQNSRGFTLVETLVAISIFLVAIISPMTIAARGLQSGYFANERITATYLAQEAIESIEKLRNDNAIAVRAGDSSDTWEWFTNPANGLNNCIGASASCDINTDTMQYHECNTADDCRLELNPNADTDGYLYGYGSGWDDSQFTRTIQLEGVGDAVSVTVAVTWESPLFGSTQDVTLKTWLYDHNNFLQNDF